MDIVYANAFPEKYYLIYLHNPLFLEKLSSQYSLQYSKGSSSHDLALKDSLDHYIYKRIMENDRFLKSQEFYNYGRYLNNIINNKTRTVNGKKYYMELVTNAILRDDNMRQKFFSALGLSVSQISSINHIVIVIKEELNRVLNRMARRERISQEELDFIGDYIYSTKNVSDDVRKIFLKYVFNELKEPTNIKPSIEIVGAFLQCLPGEYIDEERIKNMRYYVGDYDKNGKTSVKARSHLNPKCYYCHYDRDMALGVSFKDDKALEKSRGFKINDVYFLLFVAFHELTHAQLQCDIDEGKRTSRSFFGILNSIFRDMTGESYYKLNHDVDEIEIDADEKSWENVRNFVFKNSDTYQRDIISKCVKNCNDVRARRAFSFKIDENGNLVYCDEYDIQRLKQFVQNNPSILQQYPVLQYYIDQNNNLNIDRLFEFDLSSYSNVDYANLAFAKYILDYEGERISNEVKRATKSPEEVKQLIVNLYHIYHQNVLKVRDYKNARKDTYDETHHNYNETADIESKFFIKHAKELFNVVYIFYCIQRSYPNVDPYANSYMKESMRKYFYELYEGFDLSIDANRGKLEEIEKQYRKLSSVANDDVLLELADFIRTKLDTYGQSSK